jgi:hypothetical protein
MKDVVESIMDVFHANPIAHARAIMLAKESTDESLSVLERMVALVQLDALIKVAQTEIPKKPEYKWVNGARVKVK